MGHYDSDYEEEADLVRKAKNKAKNKAIQRWKNRNEQTLNFLVSGLTVGELFKLFQQLQDDLDDK